MKRIDIPPELEPFLDRLSSLTPNERKCMLLVDQGYITKQIITKIDLTYDQTNKIIGSARKKLSDLPRRDAARIVAAYDACLSTDDQIGHSLAGQPLALPQAEQSTLARPANDGAEAQIETARAFAEDQEQYSSSGIAPHPFALVPLRIGRRQANDLSSTGTLITFAVLTAAGLVAVGSAISLLSAIETFLQR